jgi:hypothetical protein
MTDLSSAGATTSEAGGELFTSGRPPRELWGRGRSAAPAALLIMGLLVGGGSGAVLASSDPTKSSEYQALRQKLRATEAQVAAEKTRADSAQRVAAAFAAEVQSAREALVMGEALAAQQTASAPR